MEALRIWTVDEVHANLPHLQRLVRRVTASALSLEFLRKRRQRAAARDARAREIELQIEMKQAELEAARRTLERLGARVEDPRAGACELRVELDGRPAWLRVRHDDDATTTRPLEATKARLEA